MRNTSQTPATADEQPGARPPTKYSAVRTLFVTLLFAPGAGLAASLIAVVVMGIFRLLLGIPTPMELFGDFVLKHINVHAFILLLNTFAPNTKTAPLGLALLGMIGAGIVLGILYSLLVWQRMPIQGYRPSRREWLTACGFALAMTLLGVILFWDETRQNTFGLPIAWARLVSSLGLTLEFSVYAVVLCLVYRALLPKQTEPATAAVQGRRLLLSRAGVAALTVGAGAGVLGVVGGFFKEYSAYDGSSTQTHNGVTPAITTNDEHYIVTQNALDPSPVAALWRLEVTGLVGKPGTYTYEEIQNLPSTSRAVTLECISNEVGGHLMSTAIWQGVTMSTLLSRHGGVQASGRYVAFHSVDGYTVSQPLDVILAADTLVAWRMNGAEIPQRHGYPLRVLMPGRYGEENPKWLTRIEVTDHFVGGLYSNQGWYNGPLHTTSRIDRPTDRVALGQATEVGGIAFAGDRGIQKVEVSVDGGVTWQQANLQVKLSQDAWVLWTWQWKPMQAGMYTLMVRATDGTGELQSSTVQRTVPNGSMGYHKVKVQVA